MVKTNDFRGFVDEVEKGRVYSAGQLFNCENITNDEVEEVLDDGFVKMLDDESCEVIVKFVIYDTNCYLSENIDLFVTDICMAKGENR